MDNVTILKGLYGAFGRGDIPTVLGAMSPGIRWYESESNPREAERQVPRRRRGTAPPGTLGLSRNCRRGFDHILARRVYVSDGHGDLKRVAVCEGAGSAIVAQQDVHLLWREHVERSAGRHSDGRIPPARGIVVVYAVWRCNDDAADGCAAMPRRFSDEEFHPVPELSVLQSERRQAD